MPSNPKDISYDSKEFLILKDISKVLTSSLDLSVSINSFFLLLSKQFKFEEKY